MSDINIDFFVNNSLSANLTLDSISTDLTVNNPLSVNFALPDIQVGGAAGNIGEIQFNGAGGLFSASAGLVYSSGILNIGGVGIQNGEVALKTISANYGPGGINQNIQGLDFNAADAIAGDNSGSKVRFFAGAGSGTGAGGDIYFEVGTNQAATSGGKIEFATVGLNLQLLNSGAIGINTNTGLAGQVLTSAGSGAPPTWSSVGTGSVTSIATTGSGLGFSLTGGPITTTGTVSLTVPNAATLRTNLNIGNVANLNLSGNPSNFLNGTGSFSSAVTSVATSGSGLGFSLGGGPITGTGTVTLSVPDATTLRTNLSIGNVANLNLNGNASTFLNGTGSFSGLSLSELTNLKYAYEAVTIHTHDSGTYNYDTLTSTVSYSTAAATNNITLNFRGNATVSLSSQVSAGKSVTAVYLMTTSTVGYIPNVIRIDGVSQTVRYVNNTAPLVIPNTICSYTYTLIKVSDSPVTWTVLGSQTRYG